MIYWGIDCLLALNPSWKKKRIALVTNHAAINNNHIPTRQALQNEGFSVVKLFSPEHGLDVKGADGAKMNDGIDALTKLPVISLYNNKLAPDENDLKDIDIILFDIPDIGCRFYTYLWTMTHVLEAAAHYQKKLIILDRPNPISGNLNLSEAPMLDEKYCVSFIGRYSIPLRHSCTLGELALYFNQTKNIHADLEIIKCKGWQRNMFQPDWGIPFVPTSPAIKNFQSALLYPGLGLLEATNISEGRGTEKPFVIIGAPWIDTSLLIKSFIGLSAKAIQFIPTESKYANETCNGIEFEVKNPQQFNSVQNGLLLIKLIKDLHPEYFQWKPYPTNVNPNGKNHLDKLLGIHQSEQLFNLSLGDFKDNISVLINSQLWQKNMQPYLLY